MMCVEHIMNSNIYVDVKKPCQEEGKIHSHHYCLYHITYVLLLRVHLTSFRFVSFQVLLKKTSLVSLTTVLQA